jgi:PIN domain nuclease of toxin-antitoxin system
MSRHAALDASALLVWVLDERGAETVGKVPPVAVILPTSLSVEPFMARDFLRAAELIAHSEPATATNWAAPRAVRFLPFRR